MERAHKQLLTKKGGGQDFKKGIPTPNSLYVFKLVRVKRRGRQTENHLTKSSK
jgi:hypothetical protein